MNIIDLLAEVKIYLIEFTLKCPVTVCTQTAHWDKYMVLNVLRKSVLSGPSDIRKVQDNVRDTYKNKVYSISYSQQ